MIPLPVDQLIPELTSTLKTSATVIVEAPPGSGKTTRIAPSLIDAGLSDADRRVFLLQPRRVAARATAERIADERGWKLGHEVGYQVRFDSKFSKRTPLIVATEGILLRRLNSDATLEGVGTIILDEFHERSLNTDLILGMVRRVQQVLREDLKLIVMSATLDATSLEAFLAAPRLKTTGTLHPVELRYRPPRLRQNMMDHVVETVVLTAERSTGDVLVFLPGVGEISRAMSALSLHPSLKGAAILPLHGSLPLEKQNQVLRSSQQRRIVLATNVAETSLTLEGIRTVIDSGQVRVLRFEPAVGLDRLQLEPICHDSATQRAGRAGRLESGVCVRLWDEKSHRARAVHLDPEIRRVDLSSAVLQLFHWGETPEDFPWLDAPRADALVSAVRLLELLGAVDDGSITKLGRSMVQLPVSPRIARMLIEGARLDALESVSLAAAMLSERDPFLRDSRVGGRSQSNSGRRNQGRPPTKSQSRWDCDVTQRLHELQRFYDTGAGQTAFGEIHRGAAHTIRKVARQFVNSLQDLRLEPFGLDQADTSPGQRGDAKSDEAVQRAMLAAFPDRLARRRKSGDSKGRMVGGRGVKLAASSGVSNAELFLCIDVDAGSTEATVRQASGIDFAWLSPDALDDCEEQFFNPTRKQVEARRRKYFHDLLLNEQPTAISDEQQCVELLVSEAAKNLPSVMPDKNSNFASYLQRMRCLRGWAPELELPDCDDTLLVELVRDLSPRKRSFAELQNAPWLDWLKSRLTPEQQRAVELECPERIEVPSGNRIKLDYANGTAPVLAVRIQEVFSWTDTPRIAFGRVPVLLHLLAPNMRPQQVTDDLASFWSNTYEVVRKELRRRYPKHAWPEDPLTAEPVRKR